MASEHPSIEILGYKICRLCEAPVLEEISNITGKLCSKCWRESESEMFAKVELLMERRVAKLSDPVKTRRNRRVTAKRKNNPEYRKRKKVIERAQHRAMKRLRALHPNDYAVLLAEERGKAGLEPWPVAMAINGYPTAEALKTLRASGTYHAADGPAEDVDAAS